MADTCHFEIHVRGEKKNAYALMRAIRVKGAPYYHVIDNPGDQFAIQFDGECEKGLQADADMTWDGVEPDLSPLVVGPYVLDEAIYADQKLLTAFDIKAVRAVLERLSAYSLRDLSAMLHVEIEAHSWSEEAAFDRFEHYADGRELERTEVPLTRGSDTNT